MEGWLLLAPSSLATAMGLTIMALSSSHWTGTSVGYAGLWNECYYTDITGWSCIPLHWHPNGGDTFGLAVKVLVVSSVVLGLVTAVASAFAYHARSWMWSLRAALCVSVQVLLLMAGLFTFLAYIMKYGNRHHLSWSYNLGWISAGFYMLTAIFYVVQAKRLKSSGGAPYLTITA